LVIDYFRTPSFVDDSYNKNNALGYISSAADHRQMDNIPTYPPIPYNANSANIASLSEAKNFLYLVNPSSYSTKEEFLNAIRGTNYDVVILISFIN
jgi:cysteinyl-tRNA synthetase